MEEEFLGVVGCCCYHVVTNNPFQSKQCKHFHPKNQFKSNVKLVWITIKPSQKLDPIQDSPPYKRREEKRREEKRSEVKRRETFQPK
jgi:hypothetical protein